MPSVLYLKGLSELQLSLYEHNQTDNDCVPAAISEALRLAADIYLTEDQVGHFAWTTLNRYPFGAMSPRQAARTINWLSDLIDAKNVSAEAKWMTPRDLRGSLTQSDQVVILFLNWTLGNQFSGHGLILGAYDETHIEMGEIKPWGLLNWHGEGDRAVLFWMGNQEFIDKLYGYYLTKGQDNTVVVSHK